MQVIVRGKKWAMRWVNRLADGNLGDCSPPDEPGRVIRIARGQSPESELDTIIHEILHAAHWDLNEEAVEETAEDIARVLWKLGYRKQ